MLVGVCEETLIFVASNKIYVDDAVALPQNGGAFFYAHLHFEGNKI